MAEPSRYERIRDALMQTWPARAAKGVLSGLALPGDVYAGRIDPLSDEGIQRAVDLAGTVTLGGFAAPAQAGPVLGSMATRRAKSIGELERVLAKDFPAVDFVISQPQGAYVALDKLVVPPAQRGQGIGTKFLQDVLDYADANHLPTGLTPDGAFGGKKSRLVDWYSSHGFIPNKGRRSDHSISQSMYRPPKGN
jgi:GNAT superfamily N-acetyltransferase